MGKTKGYVIRDKKTGEATDEMFCGDIYIDPKSDLEVVTPLQHLQDLNNPETMAYKWSRRLT